MGKKEMSNVKQKLSVSSTERMAESDSSEQRLLEELLREAESYLSSFKWCGSLREEYFGLGVGAVVGVFLFRIENLVAPEDEWLWVVVGDIPPAYLVVDDNTNPLLALVTYIELMEEWVEAAEHGRPVGELIPVNVAPTIANAAMLRSRLEFLRREFNSAKSKPGTKPGTHHE